MITSKIVLTHRQFFPRDRSENCDKDHRLMLCRECHAAGGALIGNLLASLAWSEGDDEKGQRTEEFEGH